MKKPVNKGGRPPIGSKATTKSLGSVRVTDDQMGAYDAAASAKNQSRSEWVRDTLDKAASRIIGKSRD